MTSYERSSEVFKCLSIKSANCLNNFKPFIHSKTNYFQVLICLEVSIYIYIYQTAPECTSKGLSHKETFVCILNNDASTMQTVLIKMQSQSCLF